MARLSLSVREETVTALRELAASLGYVARHGRTKGQGNISALLDAIEDGAVMLATTQSPKEAAEHWRRRLADAETSGDVAGLRLARAAVALAEAGDALDRAEDRNTSEGQAAWLAYVRAMAEHSAALLASETARIAQESQGRLDLGPDGEK